MRGRCGKDLPPVNRAPIACERKETPVGDLSTAPKNPCLTVLSIESDAPIVASYGVSPGRSPTSCYVGGLAHSIMVGNWFRWSANVLGLNTPCSHRDTLHLPSMWMAYGGHSMATARAEARGKVAETEKITVNLGFVDLGHVDLLVREGFYSNRTDFIRTAIRNQMERHSDVVRQSVLRRSLDLGLRHINRRTLEDAQAAGERLELKVLGLVTFADDVTPELARNTIASITVLGAMHASPTVRQALADRMH
jgi:Arc/MetJ-type ribon-helix-helix transcriptional regulator